MIEASARPLSEALKLGIFGPAPVQREYQWTTEQASALLQDIFLAFERLGLDPDFQIAESDGQDADDEGDGDGDGVTAADSDQEADAFGRDGSEMEGDASDADETESFEEIDDGGAGTDENAPLEYDSTVLKQIKVTGRGRTMPPPVYNLNSIVLLHAPEAKRPNNYHVYDGLQRLTTLTLLLAALRDHASTNSDLRAVIDEILLSDQDEGQHRVYFPTTGQTLNSVIKGRKFRRGPKEEPTLGDNRLRAVYADLCAQTRHWSDLRRAKFLAFLLSNVYLTVQILRDRSLAYQTFVTANNRGLNLTVGDILKGQLVEQANAQHASQEQIRQIESGWDYARGKLYGGGMQRFIQAIESLKFGLDSGAAPGERLLEQFDDTTPPAAIVDWVRGEYRQMTDAFAIIQNHYKTSDVKDADRRFRQLSFLGWDDWYPVALALVLGHKGPHKGRGWVTKINRLYRACYTMELLGWRRQRSKQLKLALEQLERGLDPFNTKAEPEYGALSISPYLQRKARENLARPFNEDERRGAIVRWLETLYWRETLPLSCSHEATVEHVLPVSSTKYWTQKFSDQERDTLTNLLGNLCILHRDANRRIGNSDWTDKQAEYERWRKQHQTVRLVLAEPGQDWTADKIRSRTRKLAKRATAELNLMPGNNPPSRNNAGRRRKSQPAI